MKFFSDFERKYQKYAIRNLMYYITILYAVGLIVWMLDPMIYYNYLSLNVGMILHGQIWRLVTFLIYPPAFGSFSFTQIFYGLIALFLYYNLGQTLEYVWGSFRFNVFFFMGVLAQIVASFVGYLVFHQYWLLSTGFLNASLFLAFCIINRMRSFICSLCFRSRQNGWQLRKQPFICMILSQEHRREGRAGDFHDHHYPVFPDDPKLQALRAEGDQTPAGIQAAGEDRCSGQDPSPLCGVRQN